MTARAQQGVVSRVWRAACEVVAGPGRLAECTVRGRLLDARRRLGNRVVVGDRVTFEPGPERGVVTAVAERRNAFSRRAAGARAVEQVLAANLDRVLAVASAASPPFRAGFLDRVLVQASRGGVPAGLAVNKTDLAGPDELALLVDPYERAGYPVFRVSAKRGDGVPALRRSCAGIRTLFVGQSGVGKSTLLNALAPGLGLREGELNPRTRKGRHTTATAWLLRVAPDLEVIDTPGMRGFALWDVDPDGLGTHYPELARRAGECRLPGCSHRQEPGCEVRAAVQRGELAAARYHSYLKLREELARERRRLVR